MRKKDRVYLIHGGQDEDAPIAGPPPFTGSKQRSGLLPAMVIGLNIVTLCAVAAVVLDRRRPDQNHNVPVEIPVVKTPTVEPKSEPAPVLPAPIVELKPEPVRVAQVPAVEPEPVRRDRMLKVEPEPVRVAETPAARPEPVWRDVEQVSVGGKLYPIVDDDKIVLGPGSKMAVTPAGFVLDGDMVIGVTRRRPAEQPVVAEVPGAARPWQANEEENYWRDERTYESIFRFHGNLARIRQPLIEFRKTLPRGITMWSERGPGRTVDIHMESNQDQHGNLPVFSQGMVTRAIMYNTCEVGMDIIRSGGPKQSQSMHSTSTAHPPGAFLTEH